MARKRRKKGGKEYKVYRRKLRYYELKRAQERSRREGGIYSDPYWRRRHPLVWTSKGKKHYFGEKAPKPQRDKQYVMEIKGNKSYISRLFGHLRKEHPSTKRRMKIF